MPRPDHSGRAIAGWSAVLAGAFLLLAVVEQNRPWRSLQAEYHAAERHRLATRIEREQNRLDTAAANLAADLEASRQAFEANRDVIAPLEEELEAALHAERWANAELRRLQEIERDGLGAEARRKLDEALRDARRRIEVARERARPAERRLADLTADLRDLEERWAQQSAPLEDLRQRLDAIDGNGLWRFLPAFDPSVKVREVTTAAGVDRCQTCHLGLAEDAGRNGTEEPAPFNAHPRLDLYVAEDSPHPVSRFGCTLCHGGEGRATGFASAGHWPTDAATGQRWTERWDFQGDRPPARPILPPPLIEAGCAHCHSGEAGTEGTALGVGRRLVLKMGCAGCHDIADEGVRDGVSAGGPLGAIAHKTTPGWAYRFIEAPRRFRPTTWMPHLFDDVPEAERRVLIRSIVYTLWERAEPSPYRATRSKDRNAGGHDGDGEIDQEAVARGAALFRSVGCAGCHLLDPLLTRSGVFPDLDRLHGPNLAYSGDKLAAGWLRDFLLDPRAWRHDTPMPDLRLGDDEADDLTAFLTASRGAPADAVGELPDSDPAVRDTLVRRALETLYTLSDAEERFAALDAAAKDLLLGEQALQAFGCAGCHDVPEPLLSPAPDAPIGSSLAGVGRRPGRFLGHDSVVAAAHPRRPFAADRWLDAAGIPDYAMSTAEADALRVRLLSWDSREVPAELRADGSERAGVLAEGYRLIGRLGCLSCHRLDDRGGLAKDAEEPSPDLTSGGARLTSSWLFAYLNDPGGMVRRPWLRLRMPSYELRPAEANALVRFFAANDHEPLFVAAPPSPQPRDVAVGRAVFEVLQCERCHADAAEADQLPLRERAPSYAKARQRLRPDWVVEWILDPNALLPGTGMPESFNRGAGGQPDSSFVYDTIAAPMFSPQSQRLTPHFETEAELREYVGDARRVAAAIRDYLWSR